MTHQTATRRCLAIAAIGILCLSILASAQVLSPFPFPLEDHELAIQTTSEGVAFVRTPDGFFEGLPDWPYEPEYVEIDGLRQGYVDEGPTDGEVVLLLHGQPSWSYLYRKMIPVLADAGFRVIAMDHLGMGRSDKPIDLDYYTYQRHVDRLYTFIDELDLWNITTFVQDWGSLIGLNVIGNHPERFARVAVGDGMLPVYPEGETLVELPENPEQAANQFQMQFQLIPDQQPEFFDENGNLMASMQRTGGGDGAGYFGNWIYFARDDEDFRASFVVEALTYFPLSEEEEAAYDAPFPARIAMGGPRTFPGLVNDMGGATQSAWDGLLAFEKPFITIWASNDPGNLGSKEAQQLFIDAIPGAAGQAHTRLPEASHFLQDDQGEEIARRMIAFCETNPLEGRAATEEVPIGYEILQVVSPTEIITWLSTDLTQEEFDAIDLPMGWFKNQPREGDADSGLFASSPGAADGVFVYEEHFGHTWRHVATIVEANVPLDDKELLRANRISKTHALSFNAGRTLKVLIAPDETLYVRVSRDAGRTFNVPTLPDGWSLIDYTTHEMLTFQLPDPTVNIRTDNEDSFQGPVSLPVPGGEEDAGREPGSTEPAVQLIEPITEIEGRVVEYYASPSSPERISRRGYRYCEILLGSLEEDELLAEVWGTQMVGYCLPEALESLDLEAVQAEYEAAFVVVNGPRFSTMDSGLFLIPEGPHRVYGELETQLIATIELDLAEVLANSGLSTALLHTVLETMDVATVLAGVDAYEESVVKRTTVFEYWAGSEVYELVSPEGVVYVMQSVSNMLDPYLTLDDLPTLDTRLSLPDGWIYRTRTLETDLVLVIFGEAIVITDDLGNTYQRR